MTTVADVRQHLRDQLRHERSSPGSVAHAGTIEILGASFIADEPTIFGTPNRDYIRREIEWYLAEDCNIYNMEAPIPQIWLDVASDAGAVNSNYGHLLFSQANGRQYRHVLKALRTNPKGRRATAIYTRPSMHTDWCRDGMQDFVCTNAVCYFIRRGVLYAIVQMRSNDAVFGYRNDYAWQRWVLEQLACSLRVQPGDIIWQAASLHLYERHWSLAEAETV